MIFLLGSVKLKVGFALGLFAIFGIIRYRTESMPVRDDLSVCYYRHISNKRVGRGSKLWRTNRS